MKFLINTAFLSSLAFGVAKAASDATVEDFAYWRDLVEGVDSLPPVTEPPTKSPTESPVVSPTDAPVASCQTIGM